MSSSPKLKALSREQKIDRYGELDEAIERFAPTLAEHKSLKEEITRWLAADPAKPAELKGKLFTIQASECRRERTIINPKKAFELLRKAAGSLDAAIAAITIPLGAAVDKFIPTSQHKLFLVTEHTGSRKLSPVRNEAPSLRNAA